MNTVACLIWSVASLPWIWDLCVSFLSVLSAMVGIADLIWSVILRMAWRTRVIALAATDIRALLMVIARIWALSYLVSYVMIKYAAHPFPLIVLAK